MSIYKAELLDEIYKDTVPIIPNRLQRVGEYYNIHQGRYTLVGSVPGVGKTSFVDSEFILKPYEWIKKTNYPVEIAGLYFSMERQRKYKLANFVSWKMFHDKGVKITADTILGHTKPIKDATGEIIYTPPNPRELTKEEIILIEGYKPWMDSLLSRLTILEGSHTISSIKLEIEKLRKRLGTLFSTDNNMLYVNDKPHSKFKGDTEHTETGEVPIISFSFKGKTYRLRQNSQLYLLTNPNLVVYVILDHIGRTKVDGYNSKKQALDALDEVLVEARDLYQFSPIPISQFNRSLSDVSRLKYNKGNLEPMYEDFKETGSLVESADLVLSLFNPYKYQSYDDKGMYKGYDIKNGMLTPSGSQRFRSLHILKNSYGIDQVTVGLKFTGESKYFTTLPHPVREINKLKQVYEAIARGM